MYASFATDTTKHHMYLADRLVVIRMPSHNDFCQIDTSKTDPEFRRIKWQFCSINISMDMEPSLG